MRNDSVCCAFTPIIRMKTRTSLFLPLLLSPKTRRVFCILFFAGAISDVRAQVNLVSNGDFKANAASFGTWPGYTGGANPASITGWNNVYGSGVGVNGASVSFASPDPFGPANPGGNTYAFIQGG